MMTSEDQNVGEELFVAHSDPVVQELDRLQNMLKEKDRELENANGEIKSLKATEVLKDKAIEELKNEVDKLGEKVKASENSLENKNLEIKKLKNEKREALAAQYAAEATLRRVHVDQRDDDLSPLESVVAPLEAEIKMYKNEIATLTDDKKALERLTKSKELALVEAEKILRTALERALIVEEVQNHNYELKRQIEICQEENKILEKTNRQKVLEVEKLCQTIQELEEAILSGAAAANVIRDYKRQVSELYEEKRTLERELARAKVSANRVAIAVANEWKDDNDKVIPVKQWLEERRILQAEMQRLKDKLAVSERTAKAEAKLKEKFKMRLKTLEDGLKHTPSALGSPNVFCRSPQKEKGKSNTILGFLSSNSALKKRSSSQPRASSVRGSPLHQPNRQVEAANEAGNMLKKGIWASKNKADIAGKENTETKANTDLNKPRDEHKTVSLERMLKCGDNEEATQSEGSSKDMVSGFLYDRLQKEVISLRRTSEVKGNELNEKDQEIKMLMKKIDALTKAIEVEAKKVKREATAREKEAQTSKQDDNKNIWTSKSSKRVNTAL